MAAIAKAWKQVGDDFEALGTHLRSHFEDLGVEETDERRAIERAVRRLVSTVEEGLGAMGKVARDPALRDDIGKVAGTLREAVVATFGQAETQVRERMGRPAPEAEKPAAPPKKAATRPRARKTTGAAGGDGRRRGGGSAA